MTRLIRLVLGVLLLAGSGEAGATGDPLSRYELAVTIDPESAALGAEVRVVLAPGTPARFTLAPSLVVESVFRGGEPAPFERQGDRLFVPGTREIGEALVIRYQGALPRSPEGGAGIGREATWLPERSGWFPHTGDGFLTYRLEIDIPDDQRAVAPGALVDEELAGGRYRAAFAFDDPADEIAIMAGPWVVDERIHRGRRLRTYFHPDIAGLAPTYLAKTAEYLDLFEAQIGRYPFAGFHVVSSADPVGLGYPGLTYMGARVLRLPFIPDTSLGHEVLHCWWGNGVYVDYAAGNWAEGLTTFMADYAFRERAGEAAAREARLSWLRNYAALPPARDAPLRTFTHRAHDAAQVTGYGKAAMTFLMLRDEIGVDRFEAGLRTFWERHRFRLASWADLVRAFEDASDRDLGWFFDQWLDRTGAPEIGLEHAEIAQADSGYTLSFSLSQAAPGYVLGVPVVIETEAGTVRRRIRLAGERDDYALDVASLPLSFAIDPDSRLFRRLAPGEAPPILRDVTLEPATVVLVAARDPAAAAAARALVAALQDSGSRELAPGGTPPPDAPLIVVGLVDEVREVLDRLGLPGPPAALVGRGTARAWTFRRANGTAVLAIESVDSRSLEMILRPLPHYGAKSYLVFEGARALEKGVWPPGESTLNVSFR